MKDKNFQKFEEVDIGKTGNTMSSPSGYKGAEQVTSVSDVNFSGTTNLGSSRNFQYIKHSAPGMKKSKTKIVFQRILDDVLDKHKWEEKWTKIK